MAQLEIFITVDANNNTVSQYYVSKSQHVTFNNMADKPAKIAVTNPVGVPVLCEKQNDDTTAKAEFTVPAQANNKPGSVKMSICNSYDGETFKYSAEVEGTNKEDPIIIIGRDTFTPSIVANLPILGLGLIAGIALTLVVQRLFMRRRPT